MKILEMTAENIKRLSVVQITTDGAPMVVIGGENEAGKSSVIDSIVYALGGEKLLPTEPIRQGQTRGVVRLDLGDYIVTRTFTASGSTLTVTNRAGLKFPSPQALLDGLVGQLSFDPLAFADMEPPEQDKTLRRLAGIDTTAIEIQRKRVFDERTLVNRDVKQFEGAVAATKTDPAAGLTLVSTTAIVDELKDADEAQAAAANADHAAATAVTAVASADATVTTCEATITRLRDELADAEAALMEAEAVAQRTRDASATAAAAAATAHAAVPDRTALRQKIADAETTNAKVRANLAQADLVTKLTDKKRESFTLTADLARLDAEKAAKLTNATFPVEGLGLDDSGVTWNGLPFAQASTAIRVRASVAIGLALNPTLKVLLVRNGNDLGRKNLKLLADMAASANAQVWVERIAGGDGQTTVVIEDGAVAVREKVA